MNSASSLITAGYNDFQSAFASAAIALEEEFASFTNDTEFLRSKAATLFVLSWMREHFLFQKQFDSLFNRVVMPASADQFTAAVALALDKYLAANRLRGTVKSEVALEKRRGAPRPDISVWNGGRVEAVIECKTNFGHDRTGWKKQYKERSDRFSRLHPRCLSFLCVLTKENWEVSWPVFFGSPREGKTWFCLSDVWPTELGEKPVRHIINPIEPMFTCVRDALKIAVRVEG